MDKLTHTQTRSHTQTRRQTHTDTHTHTHEVKHTLADTDTQRHTHTRRHTHRHTHTHSQTHTHTPLHIPIGWPTRMQNKSYWTCTCSQSECSVSCSVRRCEPIVILQTAAQPCVRQQPRTVSYLCDKKGRAVQGTDLSLGRDPDGQGAVVPPVVLKLGGIVALLLGGGGVEPHVVDHPVVLDVEAWSEGGKRGRERGLVTG